MLIDSHCHLNHLKPSDYDCKNLDEIIAAANAADVAHILSVCVHLDEFPEILDIAKKYDCVLASVGVQPSEQVTTEPTMEELIRLGQDCRVVGIGETGLDYHYDYVDQKTQRARFLTHILAAKQLGKPLIIHTRAAKKDTLDILRSESAEIVGGVMHCFTEDWEMAKAALDLNFYISFSGIITFKNADSLRQIAKKIPLDRLLIETDAPYLAPVPYRGKPNQPAYVGEVAKLIASLRNEKYEIIAKATSSNFINLFKC